MPVAIFHFYSPFYDQLVKIFPAWVHPNHLTIAGGICAFFSNIALFYDYRFSGFVLFTLYHMLDNMDGKHARRTKQSSEIGAILDHFVDGTVGIWAGAVGYQLAVDAPESVITVGCFLFSCLFWVVHSVHAYSGFFDLGGEYVSVDELFLFLSFVRILYWLDWKNFPIISSPIVHYLLMVWIILCTFGWLYLHGHKVNWNRVQDRIFMLIPGLAYFVYMLVGGLHYALYGLPQHYGPAFVIGTFAIPYALVLWESKDKH